MTFNARVAVLLTNLWLGFPYMFLVCTGALQSIPAELREAATDRRRQTGRHVCRISSRCCW